MQCGCLTKQSSLAFEYARNFKMRFVIGTGAVINGQPKLYIMRLDKNNRWDGTIV
jgi:hypothetical protein